MGIAMAFSGQSQISTNPMGDLQMAFIIEQFIPQTAKTKFVKYIGNNSGEILLSQDDSGYDLALFLSFCQHVQWLKTGVYISDYQGAGGYLTDPQIMTA
jgi:hypothetical protein